MNKDRTAICDVISYMLDNPDKNEIYPTSTAYAKLEHYVEEQRLEALGWAHADACVMLDKGLDPRTEEVPGIVERAMVDLAK